jgi:hypothetical protein
MTDQELRALVREAIARHLGTDAPAPTAAAASCASHVSHARFELLRVDDGDPAMCIIEPAVRCNHCGFCQSYGH